VDANRLPGCGERRQVAPERGGRNTQLAFEFFKSQASALPQELADESGALMSEHDGL
jgi:hypothetical protein